MRLILARPVDDGVPRLTFIGNATMLLRLSGSTLLTDPSFLHAGEHVHLGYGVFAERRLEPALAPRELPPLDAVLLSHLHGDHWDPPAERALSRALPIVTTPQAARTLAKRGFTQTIGLPTWETVELVKHDAPPLKIIALPAQHGPRPIAALLPATNGYLIEATRPGGAPLRIYVSGDTLEHRALAEIPARFPAIDVALLHLGGTRIPAARFGILVTLDAARGVAVVRLLDPRSVIPVHTDDWSVFSSSLNDFVAAMDGAGLASRLRTVERGESIEL